MEKFTPGPWEASKMFLPANVKDRRSGMVINGPDTNENLPVRICDMRSGAGAIFAEVMANAQLISASPEMLEALKSAKKLLQLIETQGITAIETQFADETAIEIEEAITKATGN